MSDMRLDENTRTGCWDCVVRTVGASPSASATAESDEGTTVSVAFATTDAAGASSCDAVDVPGWLIGMSLPGPVNTHTLECTTNWRCIAEWLNG